MSTSDVLDLDGEPAPARPFRERPQVIGVKVPGHLYTYVQQQAWVEHCTINAWMRRLIETHRDGDPLPADVRDWLVRQAAQCDTPGDPNAALIAVVRHLAARWPNGARLAE